jgi:hypothetical protein
MDPFSIKIGRHFSVAGTARRGYESCISQQQRQSVQYEQGGNASHVINLRDRASGTDRLRAGTMSIAPIHSIGR